MKKILLCLFIISVCSGFSSKRPDGNSKQFLTFEDCKGTFSDTIKKAATSETLQVITAYKVFPCFPLESVDYMNKKHGAQKWAMSEFAKQRVLAPLSDTGDLKLSSILLPFVKEKSETEKYLLKIIALKTSLNMNAQEEQKKLWRKFPSHNPNRLKKPDLSVVRDLKRRSQNLKALKLLKTLNKKRPQDLKIQKTLVSTQKNIARNADYLNYSQKYVNSIYRKYKRNRRNSYYKEMYLSEALKNIRRIWTYQSTRVALTKLDLLIKFHCKPIRKCAEHYWIKGRIHEELGEVNNAHIWLKKAVETTSLNNREYQNRVWNLVWLESKILGPKQAVYTATLHLSRINEKEVYSKLYYWMSKWSDTKAKSDYYVSLIKTHHPMSFYLWSDLALGEGIDLKVQNISDFKSSLKAKHEISLLKIMESGELSLAQSYIKHIERTQKIRKTLNWKKLKALNGMYADLALDLKAGNISASDNLQFFFSRGFYDDVITAGSKFAIDKELIWSITRQESNFNPYARSWADAFGLMQILPKRAVSYINDTKEDQKTPDIQGINPFKLYDPSFNISIGAWLLRENLDSFSNKLPLAIAAYNASAKKVEEWERRFYKGDWMLFTEEVTYRETRKYIKLVLRNKEIYTALEKAQNKAL